jgi:hypothetical protein
MTPFLKKNIVDCFPYFNEKELLELRIRMLSPYVDQFVISEANTTHSGIPKEFTLKKTIEELGLPAEKITVLEVDFQNMENLKHSYIDFCHASSANSADDALSWTRERLQRGAVADIVDEFDDNTVFIMSDCDEIIRPDMIDFLVWHARKNQDKLIRVPLMLLESRADLQVYHQDGEPAVWEESMFLCMKHHIKSTDITLLKANRKANEFNPWPGLFISEKEKRLENLGWHFTWMGDAERLLYKSKSFIHHSNLNVVNNASKQTLEILSKHLVKDIKTPNQFKLVKLDHKFLPKEIFDNPRVFNFLIGSEIELNTQLTEEPKMDAVKIINAFPYNGQKELLELRIRALSEKVDQFVIIDISHTLSGEYKGFTCNAALQELGLSSDKIKVVEHWVPCKVDEPNAAVRERMQRDEISKHLPENSQCFITDEDEILDPLYVDYYLMIFNRDNKKNLIRIPMAHLSGRANLAIFDQKESQEMQVVGSYLCTTAHLEDYSVTDLRDGHTIKGSWVTHNYIFLRDDGRIENAGWKFEWMGSAEHRLEKYKSSTEFTSHSFLGKQIRTEFLTKYEPQAGGPTADSKKEKNLIPYPESKLPKALTENTKFREYFLPAEVKDGYIQKPLTFDHSHMPYIKISNAPRRVVIIDDFYEDPYAVREFALNQEFFDDPGYIGRRTRKQFFFPGLKARFEDALGIKIQAWEEHGMNGRFQHNWSGEPLVYHTDSQQWAGLIYLTPNAPFSAGTKLLAHRETKVRHNSDPRIMDCFNQKTFLDPSPYETVDVVGNVFNRCVLYSGGLIHAASEYFGYNLETSRLWHMFFFD